MDKLRHINTLYQVVGTHLVDCLKGSAQNLLQACSEYDDLPHIMLFGKSPFVLRKYIEHFLTRYSGTSTDIKRAALATFDGPKQTFIQYRSGSFYTEIDMDHADKFLLSELIKSIADHKGFGQKRHIIILNRIERMPEHMESALRNILENFTKNTLFVIVANETGRLNETIKSRCMIVNCNINMDKICRLFLESIDIKLLDSFVNDPVGRRRVLMHCDNDPINLAILCELDNPMQYKGHLYCLIDSGINAMIVSYKKQDLLEYSQRLRDFAIKIGAACVPIKDVAVQLLEYAHVYWYEKIPDVVECLTDMEHASNLVNKHIFVLENYIDKIVRIFCT